MPSASVASFVAGCGRGRWRRQRPGRRCQRAAIEGEGQDSRRGGASAWHAARSPPIQSGSGQRAQGPGAQRQCGAPAAASPLLWPGLQSRGSVSRAAAPVVAKRAARAEWRAAEGVGATAAPPPSISGEACGQRLARPTCEGRKWVMASRSAPAARSASAWRQAGVSFSASTQAARASAPGASAPGSEVGQRQAA